MTDGRYSVIRYIPDPGRGESLNIGILVWAGDEFRLSVDEKAVERVIRENPRLERDALLYVEPLLTERLSSAVVPVPTRITRLLEDQKGFPIELSEPLFTRVDLHDEGGLDATLERLTGRVVTPRRRQSRSGPNPVALLERRLKPLIRSENVTRNHFFSHTRTGVPRKADFYANTGAEVALDYIRLALHRADEIRLRADAEAFKVYDILAADPSVREYVVFCEFRDDRELDETNRAARQVLEAQDATIVTELEDAVRALSTGSK
jgi:DUF3037 family protein